ncbi:MAG: ComF family protein [Salibacteraceae bacterium]
MNLTRIQKELTGMLFPSACCGCGRALAIDAFTLCSGCEDHLPLTKYWNVRDNPVERLFWGKIFPERASSFLFFTRGGMVQQMIHQLKYRGKTDVGTVLGQKFGEHLNHTQYAECDLILPVPLHRKRQQHRGYNQCDFIASGLSLALNIPIENHAVKRVRYTESQTRKGVYQRWINVKELFEVAEPERVASRHVLLVDDVVTTGSTLEACAGALQSVPGTRVSIATIAIAAPV